MQHPTTTSIRLALFSDLHLEFSPFEPPALQADIVVLAGDIGPKLNGLRLAEKLSERHEVVYVLGNHEYYATHTRLAEKLKGLASPRVHVLENDEFVFRGVRFLGCTLWTDFELDGNEDLPLAHASANMNDYHRIRDADHGYKKLRPQRSAAKHRASAAWLKAKLREPFAGKTVVVTHHAPSARSIGPKERRHPLASAYASNLDELVQNSNAALWLHGHTHTNVDYQLGETRVLTNQRGYAEEPVPGFDASGNVVEL